MMMQTKDLPKANKEWESLKEQSKKNEVQQVKIQSLSSWALSIT